MKNKRIQNCTGLETHHPSLLGFMMHDTTKKDDEVKEVKEEKEAKEEKVEKEQEVTLTKFTPLGEDDPMYEYYQSQNWKVCFPLKQETEKKSRVWYLCDDETREVHRVMIENTFVGPFGLFVDGYLLAVMDTHAISNKTIVVKSIKNSHFNLECTGDGIVLTIRFRMGGRDYELVRGGYREDFLVPCLRRRVRLHVDGLEPSPSSPSLSWKPRMIPLTVRQLKVQIVAWIGVQYLIVLFIFVFPPIFFVLAIYYVYIFGRAFLHRKVKPNHYILPKRAKIESILVQGEDIINNNNHNNDNNKNNDSKDIINNGTSLESKNNDLL